MSILVIVVIVIVRIVPIPSNTKASDASYFVLLFYLCTRTISSRICMEIFLSICYAMGNPIDVVLVEFS